MTKKIEKMDRASAKVVGQVAIQALREALAERGILVDPGRGTFDPSAGTLAVRYTFTIDGAIGKQGFEFSQLAELYGLEAEDLGRTFFYAHHEYRVVGLNSRAPKKPIVAERLTDKGGEPTGNRFRFRAEYVSRALGRTSK